jgi:hypothetical protein
MGYERPASSERSSVENNEVAASHDNNKNVEERASENNIYCRRYIYLNVDNDHVEFNVVTQQLPLDGVIRRPVSSSPVDVFP